MEATPVRPDAPKRNWTDPDLVLDQWQKYEAIAMHFNDLLMRFRTQALAGLAAVAALAGLLKGAQGIAALDVRVFFCVLLVFWGAIWLLDQGYYSRLLSGAVKTLQDFEATTKDPETQSLRIMMSTNIEKASGVRWKCVVFGFYLLISLGLLALIVLTFYQPNGAAS